MHEDCGAVPRVRYAWETPGGGTGAVQVVLYSLCRVVVHTIRYLLWCGGACGINLVKPCVAVVCGVVTGLAVNAGASWWSRLMGLGRTRKSAKEREG